MARPWLNHRSELVGEEDLTITTLAPDIIEPGQALPVSILAANYTDKSVAVDLAYSFQRDSTLYSTPIPDPVFGSNHAPRLRSWIVADDELIEDGSLTDGRAWMARPWLNHRRGHGLQDRSLH